MANRQLHDTLVELERELRSGAKIADEDRELVEQVKDDLEKLLDSGESPGEVLRDRVNTAVERFEAQHPTLSSVMSAALDALNKLGV